MEQDLTVASLIASRIEYVEKTHAQIAKEVGFNKLNVVSMIKTGVIKLPLAKVPSMARALEFDPLALMVMCLKEYQPGNWEALSMVIDLAVTDDERQLLMALRRAAGGPYLSCIDNESRGHLDALVSSLRESQATTTVQ